MAYQLIPATGTARLTFLHGYATGMSKYDEPLSLEHVHETAEMFMAELAAAIEEIERDLHERYAMVDSAGCDCDTCQEIRRQQGREPQETVARASSSSEADWYNPVPQDPALYRDCYCDDHGDCAAIYRDDAWRCVICGKPVSLSGTQEA